ncbi:MAG: hypothetical protein NVS1B4_21630 [Gemmatimonadaceae bacterium]
MNTLSPATESSATHERSNKKDWSAPEVAPLQRLTELTLDSTLNGDGTLGDGDNVDG